MNSWDKMDEEMDGYFAQVKKVAALGFIIWFVVAMGTLSGIGYVAYLLLRHFGVI